MKEERRYQRYTPQEDRLLRKGATQLPGRNSHAVYQRRRELGLVKPVRWTKDEIELAKQGICPEGRSQAALRCVRNKLGLKKTEKVGKDGQMELVFPTGPSAHSGEHIPNVVARFVKTALILSAAGLTAEEIAEQTSHNLAQVQQALSLAESLRLK